MRMVFSPFTNKDPATHDKAILGRLYILTFGSLGRPPKITWYSDHTLYIIVGPTHQRLNSIFKYCVEP